jgi:drug/metabolite transporter (DMT)-like permease
MFNKNNYINIHIAVLLFGLAGLFAKFIDLPSTIIVLGRVAFAALSIGIVFAYLKQSIKLKRQKDYLLFIVMGIILAIHWVTFFQSIKTSTIAVGLLSYSTFPVFSAFIEPAFFKEKILFRDIIIALITFFGIVMIIPEFNFANNITKGVLWGVTSGLSFSLLSILNRKYVLKYPALVITFYQDVVALVILLPFLFLEVPHFNFNNICLLILLGVLFTAVAHSLFIKGLSTVKARTAGIIASLEPVYGIIFAILFLNELPNMKVIAGGIIILSTALYVTMNTKSNYVEKK